MKTRLTYEEMRQLAQSARERLRRRTTGPRWLRSDSVDLSYLLLEALDENAELRKRIEAKDRAANSAESRYEQQQAKLENQEE